MKTTLPDLDILQEKLATIRREMSAASIERDDEIEVRFRCLPARRCSAK